MGNFLSCCHSERGEDLCAIARSLRDESAFFPHSPLATFFSQAASKLLTIARKNPKALLLA